MIYCLSGSVADPKLAVAHNGACTIYIYCIQLFFLGFSFVTLLIIDSSYKKK